MLHEVDKDHHRMRLLLFTLYPVPREDKGTLVRVSP